MSTCNYKTLNQTGKLDTTHSGIVMTPQWGGPGFDLGVPDCRTGGFGTLTTAYNNNGNGCNNGHFVQGLCGGNKVITRQSQSSQLSSPPSPPPPSEPQSPIQSSDVLKYCSENPTTQCYKYLSGSGGDHPFGQELNIPLFIKIQNNTGYQCPSGIPEPDRGDGFYDVLYQEDGKVLPTKNGKPVNDIFSCNMKTKECAYFSDRKPGQKIRGEYCPSYTSLTDGNWQENSYCGGISQSENDNCPSGQFSYKAPPVPGLKNICCSCGQGNWSQCK